MAENDFRQIYDEHFRFVWRSLRRLGVRESDIADTVQEVFVVVHRKLAQFEAQSTMTTWLFAISMRVARDHRKSAVVRREIATEGSVLGDHQDPLADTAGELTRTIRGSLPVRLALALGVTLVITVGCGGTVTNVGSIVDDGGSVDAPGPGPQDGSPPGAERDASLDALDDAALDAHHDAETPCAAGACGANVCGRDECGHSCGACPGAPIHGGCFTGHCIASCPGTPCLDHDGSQICEGGRGGRSCVGGTLGIQVCTCTGGGADAWISCGACL